MDKAAEFQTKCLESLKRITKKPESFLEPNEDISKELKEHLKSTYDFVKSEEIKTIKSNALPELIVRDFDLEQIWQQIELQNDSLLTRSLTNVSRLIVGKDKLIFSNLKDIDLEKNIDNEEQVEKTSEDEEEDNGNQMQLDNNLEENAETDDSNISVRGSDVSDDEVDLVQDAKKEDKSKKSVVDDQFFKLDEMEQFLRSEEKKLNDPDSGNDSEETGSESEGSVDLFQADSGDDEEDKIKTAKYKDFFVAKNDKTDRKEKRNKFFEDLDNDEDEMDEPRSSFEQRQERLKRKIEELETDAIREKEWQLKGEITAENRPQDSLLQEVVEFDLTTRPAPVITEATTMQLDDIIKQRIKDKVFDSVERKAKPVETPLEYKKKLVLDQEKSKESLAHIYEKEYLEQKSALERGDSEKPEEEPELHKEINKMMSSLFAQLDALSNFHFTPKPVAPELRIVSNLPAINMEEVAPVGVSDATLLAPEEIKNKPKGDLIGKSERSRTDKNREKRKKKLKQKIHSKAKQASLGLGNKHSKEKAKRILENVVKNKNVDVMDVSSGSKAVKSSKAFFSQLEEEVKSQIKKKAGGKKKEKKNTPDARKLKL